MSQIPGFDYSLDYHCDYSDKKTHIVQYLNKIEISTSDIKLKELNDSNNSNLLSSPLPFSANNPESEPSQTELKLWRNLGSNELDKDIIVVMN